MNKTPQRYLVQIDLDLDTERFDISVVNKNPRKGYVDMDRLMSKLSEVMHYMIREGIADLQGQITREQLN